MTISAAAPTPEQIDAVLDGLPRPYHMTNEVYFGGYEPRVLIDAIEKLAYPGLDLSHLFI